MFKKKLLSLILSVAMVSPIVSVSAVSASADVQELPPDWDPTAYEYIVVGNEGLLGNEQWNPTNEKYRMNYDEEADIWYFNFEGVANTGEPIDIDNSPQYKVIVKDYDENNPWEFAFNEQGVAYGLDSNSDVDFGEDESIVLADSATIIFDGYKTSSRINDPYIPAEVEQHTYFAFGSTPLFDPSWTPNTSRYQLEKNKSGDSYSVEIPVTEDMWDSDVYYRVSQDGSWDVTYYDEGISTQDNHNAHLYIEPEATSVIITFYPATKSVGYKCVKPEIEPPTEPPTIPPTDNPWEDVKELPPDWDPIDYEYIVVGNEGLLGDEQWNPTNEKYKMNYDKVAGIWYLNIEGVANTGEVFDFYNLPQYKVVVMGYNEQNPWKFCFNEDGVAVGLDSNAMVDFGEIAETAKTVTIMFDGYRTSSRIDDPYIPGQPEHTYFAVGSAPLFDPAWLPNESTYQLKKGEDGIFSVEIPVTKDMWDVDILYMIAQDGTWDVAYNDKGLATGLNSDAYLYIDEGTTSVIITFNPQTKCASYRCVIQEIPTDPPTEPSQDVTELPADWNPTSYEYIVVGNAGLLGNDEWNPTNEKYKMKYDEDADIWYLNLRGVANTGESFDIYDVPQYKLLVKDYSKVNPWAFCFNENGVAYGEDSNSCVDFGDDESVVTANTVTIMFDGYKTSSRINDPYVSQWDSKHTFFAAGGKGLFNPSWTPNVPEYQMKKGEDGIYSVKIPVTEDMWDSKVLYRVVQDGTWEVSYNENGFGVGPGTEACLYISKDTTSILITFDPETKRTDYKWLKEVKPPINIPDKWRPKNYEYIVVGNYGLMNSYECQPTNEKYKMNYDEIAGIWYLNLNGVADSRIAFDVDFSPAYKIYVKDYVADDPWALGFNNLGAVNGRDSKWSNVYFDGLAKAKTVTILFDGYKTSSRVDNPYIPATWDDKCTFFAAGDSPLFNPSWSANAYKYQMKKGEDDIYSIKIPVTEEMWGSDLGYKVAQDGTFDVAYNDDGIAIGPGTEGHMYINTGTTSVIITFNPETRYAAYECIQEEQPTEAPIEPPTEAPTEPPIPENVRGRIYFDTTGLGGREGAVRGVYYCNIWSKTDGYLYYPDAKSARMTNLNGGNIYYYDIPKENMYGEEITPDLISFHANGGKQTYPITFTDDCLGDTAYVVEGRIYEDPINSRNQQYHCVWKNNFTQGAHIEITSTGKVQGVCLTASETPESVADEFIKRYKFAMENGETGYNNPELITDEARAEYIRIIKEIISRREAKIKRGLPLPLEFNQPQRYKDTDKYSNLPVDWDGYHNVYYFEAPEDWVTENKDLKKEGFEIGYYWYYSTDEGTVSWQSEPAKKLSVLDENGNDIYADKNIYYAFAPSFIHSIVWNNGIDSGNPEYKQTKNAVVDDPKLNNLAEICNKYEDSIDGAYVSGCLGYVASVEESADEEPVLEWKYFNPVTGDTTYEPRKDKKDLYVLKADDDWDCDEVALNPYFDMDKGYLKTKGTITFEVPRKVISDPGLDDYYRRIGIYVTIKNEKTGEVLYPYHSPESKMKISKDCKWATYDVPLGDWDIISIDNGRSYIDSEHTFNTLDTVFNDDCFDDVCYITGRRLFSGIGDSCRDYLAWRNNTECGTHKFVDAYTGRVIGTTLLSGETNQDVFDRFCAAVDPEIVAKTDKYNWDYNGLYVTGLTWEEVKQKVMAELGLNSVKGDVTGEGEVSIVDVILILRHIVDVSPLTQEQITRADINGDNAVSVLDAVKISRLVVELDTE